MNPADLRTVLRDFQSGKLTLSEAYSRLKEFPQEELGFATLDHHRHLRQGFPEVIFCKGKTGLQILTLIRHSVKVHSKVLATRATPENFEMIRREFPEARYNELGRTVVLDLKRGRRPRAKGLILIITAGTADIYVAEETKETALIMGSRVETVYDIGAAGIHRFLNKRKVFEKARVLVVIAGMDGVLPSVIGGLTDKPLIAVPTGQGYGTAFAGIAPLLTMLNSCSAGIGVMNIDNGFGAGVLAHRINALD